MAKHDVPSGYDIGPLRWRMLLQLARKKGGTLTFRQLRTWNRRDRDLLNSLVEGELVKFKESDDSYTITPAGVEASEWGLVPMETYTRMKVKESV